MPDFKSEKEIFEFWDDLSQAALPTRRQLAWTTGIGQCYTEGVQWLDEQWRGFTGRKSSTAGRNPRDYNPTSTELRVVNNQTSKNIRKIAAHTNPDRFYIDADPAPSMTGPSAAYAARVHENLTNLAVAESGLERRAQVANFRRCAGGTWGIGVAIQDGTRLVNGQELPNKCLRTFQFNPSNLVLDPACAELDLWDHEAVGYTDLWTADAIERTFDIKLDREKLRTFEGLEPLNTTLNNMSEGRLFSRYARFSRTKGARVSWFHCRDATGRFGKWYVMLEQTGDEKEEKRLINGDNLESPFGGMGMPFGLLHAHWRTDSIWSAGDAQEMKDDQDKINLAESLFWRIIQKHAGFQWIIDQRFFGNRPSKTEIAKELTNQVGGIIMGNSRSRNEGVLPPTLVQTPAPPPFLQETIASYGLSAREKGHTSEGMWGNLKTHTPDSSFQRALEEAGQVIGVRVKSDLRTYKYLVDIIHGTTIKHVQKKNPGTLAFLTQRGFGAQEFAAVLEADPYCPPVDLSIREGSVRARSHEARKADLDFALTNKAMSPEDYRFTMADTLDSPLAEADRQMLTAARKAVLAVAHGQPWVPRPLGKWSQLFLDQAILTQEDPEIQGDPEALERLVAMEQAIYSMRWQEQALMAGPAAGPAGGGTPAGQEQEQQMPETASVADILGALSQGGPGASASAPASAA